MNGRTVIEQIQLLRKAFQCCLASWVSEGLIFYEGQLGVNFINIKRTNFSYECRFGSFYYLHVTRKKLQKQSSYEKFTHLTLMKLTIEFPFLTLFQNGIIKRICTKKSNARPFPITIKLRLNFDLNWL